MSIPTASPYAKDERDTSIVWTDADREAQIFTRSLKLARKLARLGYPLTETGHHEGRPCQWICHIPSGKISIRKPGPRTAAPGRGFAAKSTHNSRENRP